MYDILQVDGADLTGATHDEAVSAIKATSSPVIFVVQSLLVPQDSENMVRKRKNKQTKIVQCANVECLRSMCQANS